MLRWLLICWIGAAITGCALPRMIDSEVESFASPLAPQTGANYRYERLPSQQSRSAEQTQIELWADTALGKVGLVRNDALARYSVQVNLAVQETPNPSARVRRNRPAVFASDGTLLYRAPPLLVMESAWYRHSVHLVVRDTTSAQVAYESTAIFDGPWTDSAALFPVVLQAALDGFPTPPAGPRKVVIELPVAPRGTDH
jgi:hypothetical protein